MGNSHKRSEMKSIKILLVGLAAMTAIALNAQTVDEVISKHVEAMGGKDKLSQVKSIYTENSMEVMGNSVTQKEYLLEGKGFKSEVEFNGSSIIQCLTDKGGWMVNPMMGGTDAQAIPDGAFKSSKPMIYVGGALTDYSTKGYKAELVGKEEGNFKIKVTADGNETYYFLDPKTYYLTKSVMKGEAMGQSVNVTTTYSNHKKTDFGIVLPYTKSVDMGMFQYVQKIDKVEVNKAIDLKIFEMPK